MAAVNDIIKEIDRTIKASEEMFNREADRLIKTRETAEEKISISTSGTVRDVTCITCNNEKVNYSISGKWKEGASDGISEVSWKCRTNGKTKFSGTRTEVVDKLIRITEKQSV